MSRYAISSAQKVTLLPCPPTQRMCAGVRCILKKKKPLLRKLIGEKQRCMDTCWWPFPHKRKPSPCGNRVPCGNMTFVSLNQSVYFAPSSGSSWPGKNLKFGHGELNKKRRKPRECRLGFSRPRSLKESRDSGLAEPLVIPTKWPLGGPSTAVLLPVQPLAVTCPWPMAPLFHGEGLAAELCPMSFLGWVWVQVLHHGLGKKFGRRKDILKCAITLGYCFFFFFSVPQGTRKTSSTSVKPQVVCDSVCSCSGCV